MGDDRVVACRGSQELLTCPLCPEARLEGRGLGKKHRFCSSCNPNTADHSQAGGHHAQLGAWPERASESPDIFGGRRVASGSGLSLPGRQPHGSKYSSRCGGLGSGRDLAERLFQKSLKRRELRTGSSGRARPKPKEAEEGVSGAGHEGAAHRVPGSRASAAAPGPSASAGPGASGEAATAPRRAGLR